VTTFSKWMGLLVNDAKVCGTTYAVRAALSFPQYVPDDLCLWPLRSVQSQNLWFSATYAALPLEKGKKNMHQRTWLLLCAGARHVHTNCVFSCTLMNTITIALPAVHLNVTVALTR